jgi:TM2 domain-containing membrane protein YozV
MQRFGLVVHSVGWDEKLDELCGILSGRFNVPSTTAQLSLRQDGKATIVDGMSIHQVSAVIEELSRIGVVAEAAAEAAGSPASTVHVGWARVASRPRVETVDGTMIGLPRGADDGERSNDLFAADPSSPSESPAADAPKPGDSASAWNDGAARKRAAAIRAAMGATSPSPPVAELAPAEQRLTSHEQRVAAANTIISEDERIAAVNDLVADPAAAPPSSWGGVLGSPVAAPAPVVRTAATTEDLPVSAAAPIANDLLSAFDALKDAGTTTPDSAGRGQDAAAKQDRAFERLRQPPQQQAPASDAPHALRAAALSLLAPGAGQAYNNDPSRAVTFALAGLFVIPWVVSIADAYRTARDLNAKGRFVPAPARSVLGVVVGFWVLVGTLAVFYQAADRATEPDPLPDITVQPAPVVVERVVPPPDPAIEEERVRNEEQERIERQERVAGLVARARLACGIGDYVECRRLAEDALEVDESSPDAQRIHVEAVIGQSGSSVEYPEPTLDE